MTDVAIRAQALGKRYRIGVARRGYFTLRDALSEGLAATLRMARGIIRARPRGARTDDTIWALRDVTFEVARGDVVGIIGRNGSGKSTLLKVLSRITRPTTGSAEITGRVGSLLEVGTGFHPELTGRDNIYLNGAVLGMKRAEISRKFDEIVAFAEVEKFIDTPVKHYSSGMYLRLAFAVAAHLDTEILFVDEVLAVGDETFQKKCLGKMDDVARAGRTVLFVSHNMSAVQTLCQRAFVLQGGTLALDTNAEDAVAFYSSDSELCGEIRRPPHHHASKLTIDRASTLRGGEVTTTFRNSEKLLLRIECTASESIDGAQIAFELATSTDTCLLSSTSQDTTPTKPALSPGRHVFECELPLALLRAGRYRIRVSSSVPGLEILDVTQRVLEFDLVDDSSPILKLGQGRRGLILPILEWTHFRTA
jgi:lipopolysaccharide transport system ATP-binding protein